VSPNDNRGVTKSTCGVATWDPASATVNGAVGGVGLVVGTGTLPGRASTTRDVGDADVGFAVVATPGTVTAVIAAGGGGAASGGNGAGWLAGCFGSVAGRVCTAAPAG
jgi:hypothetical protein